MFSAIRRHLSYANVVATLALLFSMSGGALAANHYLVNSTDQVAHGYRASAVKHHKKKHKKPLIKAGPRGATGPTGAAGTPGPKGETGPPGKEGAPGATRIVTRYGPTLTLSTSAATGSYVACFPGEAVTGGGFDFPEVGRPASTSYFVTVDRPSIVIEPRSPGELPAHPAPEDGHAATGWDVDMENDTGSTFKFRAYVQCASP